MIKFDSESAAATACLLNNALLDGAHITVKLNPYPGEDGARDSRVNSPQRQESPRLGSQSSLFSNISDMASSFVHSVKSFDEQHKVTQTISTGAAAAWSTTKETAKSIDDRYKVQEKAKSAFEVARQKASEATSKLSGTVSSKPASTAAAPSYHQ